jgi:predicted DNA-binding transcriptional regulator AlpA
MKDPNFEVGAWEIKTILSFFQMSRRYLQMLRAAGLFPKPVMHKGKSPQWRKEDILAWYRDEWPRACKRLAERRKRQQEAGAGAR